MNPTIEEMKVELIEAGWKEKRHTVWQSPWCAHYRGPAGAYRIMKSEQESRKHGNPPWPNNDPKIGDVWGPYQLDKDGWWRLIPSLPEPK